MNDPGQTVQPEPAAPSLVEAYTIIRNWFRDELSKESTERWPNQEESRPVERSYAPFWEGARAYIESLPDPVNASDDEMLECLQKVSAGDLEFGFSGSDGKYTMGPLARSVLWQ